MTSVTSSGLTSPEAQKLLEIHGRNEITENSKHTPLQLLVSQFEGFLVWLLIFAAVISFILKENLDGTMILTIVILNAIFGYIQEFKAEQAIDALKKMTTSKSRVIRDNEEQLIDSALLVPGDFIILEQGDKVPADSTILEARNVEINEAILTGESVPVEKSTSNEEHRSIFMGTIVTRGRATAKVLQTGMKTRFGKIAMTLSTMTSDETPLEKKVNRLGKTLGIVGIGSSIVLFLIGMFRSLPLVEILLTSISMAVAAIPEGLPAVITITLAIGTQRMAKRRAILRKLAAIEALGSISVIATDKTGTLTKNEMNVTSWWIDGKIHSGHPPHKSDTLDMMLVIGARCNNASVSSHPTNGTPTIIGDPTEGALLLFALSHGKDLEELKDGGRLVEEFEFDSTIKAMSVIWQLPQTKMYQILTKGAPEVLLQKSTQILTDKGIAPLTSDKKRQIEKDVHTFAEQGLRVLAFGYRETKAVSSNRADEEKNLIFAGFVGMSDPPRPEIAPAIAEAALAGVRTIMITGDSPITARAIGHSVGLSQHTTTVVTGAEFSELTDDQAKEVLQKTNIYARISPEEKLRIVTLLKQMGYVVCVTGDGVNDALALKQADVGVAMGITGSDVAKGAADMVVTDDNYATIVAAIEEGRTIFENMKSSIKYLVGCNIGEVLSIIIGALLGWPLILTPVQILFINLITDGIPALALSVVPAEKGIMRQKPNTSKTFFSKYDLRWLAETGLLSTAIIIAAFALGNITNDVVLARTLAFIASIVVQQFFYLDLQARRHSFFTSIRPNNLLPFVGIIPMILLIGALYIPFFQEVFSVTAPPTWLLVATVIMASVSLVISEVRKKFAKSWYYPPHTKL